MNKFLLAGAALATIATPAAARDNSAYFGLEIGGMAVTDSHVRVDGDDLVTVDHKLGVDGDLIAVHRADRVGACHGEVFRREGLAERGEIVGRFETELGLGEGDLHVTIGVRALAERGEVIAAGADGVSVVSEIVDGADTRAAAEWLADAMRRAWPTRPLLREALAG